ncbi:MAG: sigma-70 family RNA polymerase sigma factor [Planctomycetes bacterium]|nr:sigma-70 family RNA polymerase sigma factor [Planctomycetota bacterium]
MANDLRQTVTQAGTGDAAAIAALLARFLPGLERHLAQHAGPLIRRHESPQDLAQSVCREVLERLRDERLEYRGAAAFEQWLYQAALHKLQNRHRFWRAERRDALRQASPDPVSSSVDPVADLAKTQPTPSQEASRREASAQVAAAMQQLPERDRQVVQWCHFEKREHAEVAALLGITPSHSRVLLARALARLAVLATGGK